MGETDRNAEIPALNVSELGFDFNTYPTLSVPSIIRQSTVDVNLHSGFALRLAWSLGCCRI